MLQDSLLRMMNELEKNNLLYTDLMIYDSLSNIKYNNESYSNIIDEYYSDIHELIKSTYFKGEDLNISSLSVIVVTALNIGVLNKLSRQELIELSLNNYIEVEDAERELLKCKKNII